MQNHLNLVNEAKQNRLKAESLYIYDYDAFNNCSMLKTGFDIFETGHITHTSCRYVIHYLTKELKARLSEIDRNTATKQQLAAFHDAFKPSLGQFDELDISEANNFIKKMFPYEGCSYNGAELEKIVHKANWITLILSLRIVWSLLPGAIIPWESFRRFEQAEQQSDHKNWQSFYQQLPLCLPSHNHCCVLFEFLEIFIAVFQDDYFVNKKNALDLIFTAGQICFARKDYNEPTENDELQELQEFYYKRGYSFYQIFISYLRALSKEQSFTKRTIFDAFDIDVYPPHPYEPVTQKALTLTVPMDPELKNTNYFKLISMAANATSRTYSSNHSFTKFENKFLDKFEVNPYKIIDNFFSKSSKNYLLKFDKNLDFENFKVNNEITEMRKNLKDGTLFEHKEFISTFISEFNRYGFESERDNGNKPEAFLADTINMNFNSNMQTSKNAPVRLSKLEISEWFINAWKYETFLGYLQNTAVIKLTKTIGDCDWLIITSHEKVSSNNRYLTPLSSVHDTVDQKKNEELGAPLQDDLPPPPVSKPSKLSSKSSMKKTLLSPVLTTSNGFKKPPTALAPISSPSPPRVIAAFEKENKLYPHLERLDYQKPMRNYIDNHSSKPSSPVVAMDAPPPLPVLNFDYSEKSDVSTPVDQMFAVSPIAPPPVVQSSADVDSMNSSTADLMSEHISKVIFTPRPESKLLAPQSELPLSALKGPRSSSEDVSKQVFESLSKTSNPSTPVELIQPQLEHSYRSLKYSPPRFNLPTPNVANDANQSTIALTIASRTQPLPQSPVVKFSPSPQRQHSSSRISSLLTHTNSIKSKISPASSPITQMFPRFLRRSSTGHELKKVPSRESVGSLSHINDGSGTDLANQFSFLRSGSSDSLLQFEMSQHQAEKEQEEQKSMRKHVEQSTESIPQISHTLRAREQSGHTPEVALNEESGSHSTITSHNVHDELGQELRQDGHEINQGEVSAISRTSDCFDMESDITNDTKNTTQGETNLDSLMHEIKQTMNVEESKGKTELGAQN